MYLILPPSLYPVLRKQLLQPSRLSEWYLCRHPRQTSTSKKKNNKQNYKNSSMIPTQLFSFIKMFKEHNLLLTQKLLPSFLGYVFDPKAVFLLSRSLCSPDTPFSRFELNFSASPLTWCHKKKRKEQQYNIKYKYKQYKEQRIYEPD